MTTAFFSRLTEEKSREDIENFPGGQIQIKFP
jgi:hypothetical protein